MMHLINQALMWGYTANNILNYVSNKVSGLSPGINNARKRGYKDEDILKFLGGKLKHNSSKESEKYANSIEKYYSKSGIKTKQERDEDKSKFLKGALGTAGTAAALYGMYNKLAPQGAIKPSEILPALPENQMGLPAPMQTRGLPAPANVIPNPSPSPAPQKPITPGQQVAAQTQAPVDQAMQPTSMQQAPQTLTPQVDSQAIIKRLGFEDFIKDAVKRGAPKGGNINDSVSGLLFANMTPDQKKWLKSQTDMPINDIVNDYLSKTQEMETQLPEQIQAPDAIQQTEEIAPPIQQIEPPKELKKPVPLAQGSKVITPDGDITTIESLPGKTAKVRIDGKSKIYDPEDLTPEPENKDEILATYEKLISQIPEQHRSSILNWVGYDPDRNLLQVKFHNGSSYTYENIPPEFAEKLKDASFMAKTSGNSYYGAWEQGESSRGAGIYQLIKELQQAYGGKGNEYSGKFNEVYSFLGIPEQKLRDKLFNERQEKKKKRKGNP